MFNSINKTQQKSLQVIQNSAMRIIFKKKREFGNKALMELTGMEPLETRLENLKKEYIQRMINSDNPLINVLIEDYERFEGHSDLKPKTILCL